MWLRPCWSEPPSEAPQGSSAPLFKQKWMQLRLLCHAQSNWDLNTAPVSAWWLIPNQHLKNWCLAPNTRTHGQESESGNCSTDSTVVFVWLPSHCGLEGNEHADTQANKAARLPQDDRPITFQTEPVAVRRERKEADKNFYGKWKELNKISRTKKARNRREEVC